MSGKPGILVLCTGNSCRSQMAAGFLRQLAGERFEIASAGSRPAVEVHPLAIEVMREVGIDLSQARPQHVQPLLGRMSVQYLIVVCDSANDECPGTAFGGAAERLFWPFDDPAKLVGSADEVRAGFRRVRDQIEARIRAWLALAP